MAKSVVALYDKPEQAEQAVADLMDSGFDRAVISILGQDANEEFAEYGEQAQPLDDTLEGMAAGGALGGLAGSALGLLALVVPGIGPVLAAGPIAAALTGAGVGIVSGGLLGALVDTGIEKEAATYYVEGIRRGSIFVGVEAEGTAAEKAEVILARHDPIDLEERALVWRDEGWKGYGAT